MFRNDPDQGAVPQVGKGSVDVGRRIHVGQAVLYDGTNPDALILFLDGDNLTNIGGELYYKSSDGTMRPMAKMVLPTIIVKPPAGDWFTVTEAEFRSEFAIHVDVPTVDAGLTTLPTATKAAAKKAAPKKAAAKTSR